MTQLQFGNSQLFTHSSRKNIGNPQAKIQLFADVYLFNFLDWFNDDDDFLFSLILNKMTNQ